MYLSTFLTDKLGNAKVFWGIKNYTSLFTSASFWTSVAVTFQFVAIVAFGGLIMGLVTSLLTAKSTPASPLPAPPTPCRWPSPQPPPPWPLK